MSLCSHRILLSRICIITCRVIMHQQPSNNLWKDLVALLATYVIQIHAHTASAYNLDGIMSLETFRSEIAEHFSEAVAVDDVLVNECKRVPDLPQSTYL